MKYNLKNSIRYRWFLLLNYIQNRIFSLPVIIPRKNTLLIIKTDSIGDYVIFRNFIQDLKTSPLYQNYRITLCGNLWWKNLSEQLDAPFISEFIWVDSSKTHQQKYMFKLYWKLYRKRFHTVINPTYSRDVLSDNLVIHSGAKYKIGLTGDAINLGQELKIKNDSCYSKLIDIKAPFAFEFDRYKLFMEQLLEKKSTILKPDISIRNTPQNTIVLCPGAKHTFRQWAPENFARLATLLHEQFNNCEFIICGSKNESHLAQAIRENTTIHCTDTTGQLNLMELVETISRCQLVITNDSGPFHIAVALNKKTICISNGNHYGRFNPYPNYLKTNSITIYPKIVQELIRDPRNIEDFQLKGSDININLLTVEEVFNQTRSFLRDV